MCSYYSSIELLTGITGPGVITVGLIASRVVLIPFYVSSRRVAVSKQQLEIIKLEQRLAAAHKSPIGAGFNDFGKSLQLSCGFHKNC